jgi:hypothetical protein
MGLEISEEAMPHIQITIDRKNRKAATGTGQMSEVRLAAKSLLKMQSDGRGLTVVCRSGLCWITQEGDPKDYLLKDKERFTTQRDGLVLIQAVADTELVVTPRLEEKTPENNS